MKNIVYAVIIGILILVSALSLLFYYTQEFSEQISFFTSLNYHDVIFKTGKSNNPISTYLQSAETILGEINLKNSGYFTEKYKFPQLFGCMNIKQGSDEKKLKVEIQIVSKEDINKYEYYNREINIPVGENKSYNLKATYNGGYDTPISLFSPDSSISLDIFRPPQKESNPLGENYYSNNYYDCNNLQDLKSIATIPIDLTGMPSLENPVIPANPI
ncbi:MAG: hypothetical protein AABX54_04620 [Nanoarchaeota archaeon]